MSDWNDQNCRNVRYLIHLVIVQKFNKKKNQKFSSNYVFQTFFSPENTWFDGTYSRSIQSKNIANRQDDVAETGVAERQDIRQS